MYEELKQDPPVARGLPPIAGKITWARQLMKRIRDPMNCFEAHPSVFTNKPEAQRSVRNFNQVATTLQKFEIVFVEAWRSQISSIRSGKSI